MPDDQFPDPPIPRTASTPETAPIQAAHRAAASPGPEGAAPALSRRSVLAGVAGVVGATLVGREALGAARVILPGSWAGTGQEGGAVIDWTRRQGRPVSEVGTRSVYEQPTRRLRGVSSGPPHEDLFGAITPADLHFERHHAGVPEIDPRAWSLLVHGLVERPTVFTLEDLRSLPSVSRIHFLECAGNFRTDAPEETPPSLVAPLTSQSEWTGVPLRVLLGEVGVLPEATWLLAEGGDGAVMARSIPVEKALDDSMIAYGQNGEPIRPEQGYPARLLNPGWEGNSSVKWIRRIELTDGPAMTRDETSRYTEPVGEGGTIRQFSFVMDARSLITHPAYPRTVEPGWIEIRGIAWSGRGKVAQVEISTDDGVTWTRADLQDPVLPKAHTRFRYLWRWDGREAVIRSRATDDTGYVQPTQGALITARGTRTAYHLNPITGWRVRPDGRVLYRTQPWRA